MRKIVLLSIMFVLFCLTTKFVRAQSDVEVYFFYGSTCPYCAKAKPFLENLKLSRKWLNVKYYEVYENQANAILFDEFLKAYNQDLSETGVPAFLVGKDLIMGFNENVASTVEQKIDLCSVSSCVSPLKVLQNKVSVEDQTLKSSHFGMGWFIILMLVILAVVILILLKNKKSA